MEYDPEEGASITALWDRHIKRSRKVWVCIECIDRWNKEEKEAPHV